jgi:phage I-like protein
MRGPIVSLAEPVGEVSEPFPILYPGDFKQGDREIPVSAADLDQAVVNFDAMKARGYTPPVDVEHGYARGKDAPAVGWYEELKRVGGRLLARVRWTDQGREQIRSGARRYFSPEFTASGKDESGREIGFTILSGALTTRPFLKSGLEVALSGVTFAEERDLVQMTEARREHGEQLVDALAEVAQKQGITFREAIELFDEQIVGERSAMDPGSIALHERALEIQRERGITYTEAAIAASEED